MDQYGDLKRPETLVGTGPWMYQRYEPNVRMTFNRNPSYFVPGLPYVDGVDITLVARIPPPRSPSSSPATSTSARSTAW